MNSGQMQEVSFSERLHPWADYLVCPLTKKPLIYKEITNELISMHAQLAFPIREGIPIMLVEEARPLDPREAKEINIKA